MHVLASAQIVASRADPARGTQGDAVLRRLHLLQQGQADRRGIAVRRAVA